MAQGQHDRTRVQAPRDTQRIAPLPNSGQEGGLLATPEPGLLHPRRLLSDCAAGSARTPGPRSRLGREREEGRLSAALGRAPTRRQLLGRCRLRSPCACLAAPRGIQSAGGCPGNGRARVASAAAPVYYCDSIYFLFGGLGERKKNPRWGQGGVGRRRGRERSPGGDGGGQWLSPASSRPPRMREPGSLTNTEQEETQEIAVPLCSISLAPSDHLPSTNRIIWRASLL
ncbi:uncharacterized protein LOC120604627 [Pteropus medius]|uniref:uncharacterized protein LOC120604627 n=1 Tax=Pteropus vampyrus TaxID=132908 RepID=UPI00196ADC05|nr:uncharacterized protein LOC120604627 [Pteropus giganteus]